MPPDGNTYGLDSAPIDRNTVFLYAYQVGIYPYAGPHFIHKTPGFMENHLRQVREELDRFVPDVNFDGPAIIDFEDWALNWERTRNEPSSAAWDAEDQDFQQDWEDYIRGTRPAAFSNLGAGQSSLILQTTYDQAAMDYVVTTLEECKRLRPRAQWGIYNYPPKRYYSSEVPRTTPRTIGYGDHAQLGSQLNDRLGRLWTSSVALFPSTYSQRFTLENGTTPEPAARQNSIADETLYIRSNIEEAMRLANGKPVYNVVWTRYQNAGSYSHMPLSPLNARLQLQVSLQTGANGTVIWDGIEYQHEYLEINSWASLVLLPAIDQVVPLIPLPPMPPLPGHGPAAAFQPPADDGALGDLFVSMYGRPAIGG